MQITLEKHGPPMWFLGDSSNLKAHLTYLDPGPVDVDFDSLTENEQKALLIALRDKIIISNENFDDLYQRWLKSRPAQTEEKKIDPQEVLRQEMARRMALQVAKREKELREKEEKFQERCRYLSQQGVNALKTAINHETDERTLHQLLRIEEQEQKRTMIVRQIHHKLRQIESQRAKEIEKATQEQLKMDSYKQKTSPLSVIQSEEETITLTPQDLINLVAAENSTNRKTGGDE